MSFTHGVGIGANGSRGVMVDPGGEVIAQAERPHKMPMRRPGWAEHRTGGTGGAGSPRSRRGSSPSTTPTPSDKAMAVSGRRDGPRGLPGLRRERPRRQDLAGASQSAAGRVFKLRASAKVRAAGEALGYRPSVPARAMITSRNCMVGPVVGCLENQFHSLLPGRLSRALQEKGATS